MIIKNLNKPFELEIKRCYLPTILEAFCPECKTRNVSDLQDDYISYPQINAEESFAFYCQECGHEWEESIKIKIHVEKYVESN